jgi:hypothetical protein
VCTCIKIPSAQGERKDEKSATGAAAALRNARLQI